jgi:hypothetical protein
MKRIIILGLLPIISIAAQSQVFKFIAFQTSSTTNFNKTISEKDWKDVDVAMEINLDKNMITTFGKNGRFWNLLIKQESFTDVSSKYIQHYEAIDGDGVRCQVYITFFKDHLTDKTATLTMIYSNYKMSFRLKNEV